MKTLMLDELLAIGGIPSDPSKTVVTIQVIHGDLPTFVPARRVSATDDSITIEIDLQHDE